MWRLFKSKNEVDKNCSAYPRATVASQPRRLGVRTVKELHVVVAAVRLLLDLESLEDELHAVTFLGRDHPLAVGGSGVVVVPELGVGEQVLGLDLGLQATAALCAWKKSSVQLFCFAKRLFWS